MKPEASIEHIPAPSAAPGLPCIARRDGPGDDDDDDDETPIGDPPDDDDEGDDWDDDDDDEEPLQARTILRRSIATAGAARHNGSPLPLIADP